MLYSQKELNLFKYQKQAIHDIFISSSDKEWRQWRILLVDKPGRLIIQSIYTINDLRENYFTLEVMMAEKMNDFPGVTVFYFVEPNEENIKIILQNACHDFYDSVEIHFLSDPGKDVLQKMAKELSQKSPKYIRKIKKMDFVNINYHPIDKDITLIQNETQLSSLISNLKYPPTFIYESNHSNFIQETERNLLNQSKLCYQKDSRQSTAVVVVSRSIDYVPVFYHNLDYSNLVIDTCEVFDLNKLKVGEHVIYLDSRNDFWSQYKHKNFSEVAQKQQQNVQKADKNSKRMQQQMKTKQIDINTHNSVNQEMKRIKNRQKFNTQVVSKAKSRDLNVFNSAEEQILLKKKLKGQKQQIKSKLMSSLIHNEDKIRFMLIYMLSSKQLSSLSQLQQLIKNVEKPKLYKQIKEKRVNQKKKQIGTQAKDVMTSIFNATMSKINPWAEQKIIQFAITKFISSILKQGGIQNITKQTQFKVRGKGGKIKSVLVYIVGGIDYKQHSNIISNINVPVIYSGDKLIKANDLFK